MAQENILRCMRCGLAYQDFPIDVVVPDEQWAAISERHDGSGVMCGTCIIARGSALPGVTVARLQFE